MSERTLPLIELLHLSVFVGPKFPRPGSEQRSFFGLSEHLKALSRHGDPLKVLNRTVDYEVFHGWLRGARPWVWIKGQSPAVR